MLPGDLSDRVNCVHITRSGNVRRKGGGHPSGVISEVARLLNAEEAFRASMRSHLMGQFIIPPHGPGSRRQWAYSDFALKLRRRVWSIDIEYNRDHYCFFDYEVRRRGEKAAALVYLLNGVIIPDSDFNMILHWSSSSEGNWKSFFSHHGLIAIKFLHTWSTAEQCVKTIARLLR